MAVVRISDLATAPVALTGTEPVEIEQGGVSYKTTAQAIADLNAGLTNPMTTAGDIIRATTGGAPQRLAVGTDGHVLTVVSGAPAWAAPTGGGGGGGGFNPGAFAWGVITANPASPSPNNYGVPITLTVVGSSGFRDLNYFGTAVDAIPRTAATATSSTTAVCGFRSQSSYFGLGPSANIGGFDYQHRLIVGNGGATSSHRLFSGFRESLSDPTDVDPSTLTNIIGVGYDSSDTQLQIMHNDGSGTATKIALGASFPKPTSALTKVYDLQLTSVAGSGSVTYAVTDVLTGATASGTISSNLPNAANGMNIWEYISAGGTATAVSLECSFWYYRLGVQRP